VPEASELFLTKGQGNGLKIAASRGEKSPEIASHELRLLLTKSKFLSNLS
jgi:hypothetical protein